MANYKQRYDAHRAVVDDLMGRPLGRWGRFKAFFAPNSLSNARKSAVRRAEAAERLYQTGNIIGSTQAHGQPPTVYYRSPSGSFGHITQQHPDPTNVGRELSRKHAAYRAGNTGGGGRFEEEVPGVLHHPSRNALVPAVTPAQQAALSPAHLNFPLIKQRRNSFGIATE